MAQEHTNILKDCETVETFEAYLVQFKSALSSTSCCKCGCSGHPYAASASSVPSGWECNRTWCFLWFLILTVVVSGSLENPKAVKFSYLCLFQPQVFSINTAHIRISQQHGAALGRFAVLEQALSFTDPNHKACLSRDSARASTFLLMNICSRHGGEQSCQVIKCIAKLKAKCMNQTFVSLCSLISKTDQNKIKSNREILTP